MGTRENLTEEHFVPVPGYDNYEISNFGRVYNVRGMELRQKTDSRGYLNVALYHNGVRREFGVHRLVAMAFFTDYSDDIEVTHVNKDRTENTVRNLSLGKKFKVAVQIVETGEVFDSLVACAESINGFASGISNVINDNDGNRHKSYLGYHFLVLDREVARA